MNRSRIPCRRLLLLAVILVFLGSCIVWWIGGNLIAPTPRPVGPPPADLPVETTTILSESGSRLAAWFVPAEDSRATLILLHGLHGDRRQLVERARMLHGHGYSILLFDFQGHGESPGAHITMGHLERHDVRAAVEFVRERNPDHAVGVIGCSLGGAAALLASPLDIEALVVESAYPTITEAVFNRIEMRLGFLAHLLTPVLTLQLRPRLGLSASDLQPIDHIANAGCPVLVAGGSADEHTPEEETRRMFEAARDPKQLAIFEGAPHVGLYSHDPDGYRKRIVSFLDHHLFPRNP